MCFETGGINHDRLALGTFSGPARHDPGKDALVAPTPPTVVEGLGLAILPGCMTPPQPMAIDDDHTADHPSIADPRPVPRPARRPARDPAAGRRKDDGRGRAWLAYGAGKAYLLDMMTFAQIVRFRIYAGSLLTRPLPRAEAGNC